MNWPQANDFQDAVLNPQLSFRDPQLRGAKAVTDNNGLPIPASGQFGIVYQMVSASGRWAVKCFTNDVPGRHERYREISGHLQNARLPFMVGFEYLEEGIFINEEWYPILKMDWVEGQTLNQFVAARADKPGLLKVLTEKWLKLARRLQETNITHADLQHGNVMLIPAKADGKVLLKLVDYDGMYLPSLAGTNSGEMGHPTYQHPQRLQNGYYGPEVDRFPQLVIYTSLLALMVKGRSLWQSYDYGDNLLFCQADFKTPRESRILRELWDQGPNEVRALAGRLVLATEQPLTQVPRLEEVLDGATVRPLTPDQVCQVERILGGATRGPGSAPDPPPGAETGSRPRKKTPASGRNLSDRLLMLSVVLAVAVVLSVIVIAVIQRERRQARAGSGQENPVSATPTANPPVVPAPPKTVNLPVAPPPPPKKIQKSTPMTTGVPPVKTPTKEIQNTLGMKFAWIPPGTFLMGSPPNEEGGNSIAEAQHQVTLTKGFYMGVHLVTQEQWQALMGDNPSSFKGEKDLPVESLSWDDCQKFLNKLREKENKPYRLPTEAEWEYACRAGTKTPFSFGSTISTDQANYNGNFTYGTGKKGVYREKTTPVGNFPANAWGLHDMHGNVYQWCQDWYGDDPRRNDVVDPQGPSTGNYRILRGGSWLFDPQYCRSAFRLRNAPGFRNRNYGCRVCFCVD